MAFNNTSAVDICSCVYLITYQALHSPTFRPHAQKRIPVDERKDELNFAIFKYLDLSQKYGKT